MRANLKTAAWIGAAIVLGSAVYGTKLWKFGVGASDKPPPYQTSAIDRGPIIAKLTASGTLSALVTVQVSGRVALGDDDDLERRAQLDHQHRGYVTRFLYRPQLGHRERGEHQRVGRRDWQQSGRAR